jgi:acyl-CoA thioester hydrolase
VANIASEKEVFMVEVAVRWGDQDAQGHVNNVSYFRYLEEARVQWLAQWQPIVTGMPVAVTAGAIFLRPILYPATLHISVEIGAVGTRSITLNHRILDAADLTRCYAEGHAKLVWIDPAVGRSLPLPEPLLQKLEAQRSA